MTKTMTYMNTVQHKIDKKIPFKFHTDKENIKKVVVSITLTTAFKLVLNV